jgi:hypothetical protein
MKHLGSTLAIILGTLLVITGLSKAGTGPDSINYINCGIQTLLGAMAYRWAKKRKHEEIPNTGLRKTLECVLIFFVVAITVFRNDLRTAIVADPIANLVIPAWIVIAYAVAALKKPKP